MWCGQDCFTGYFLLGPVPHELLLGLDWLTEQKLAWYFQSDKLRTCMNGKWCGLPVVRTCEDKSTRSDTKEACQRTPAEQAYDTLAIQVGGMTSVDAAVFVRPPPRRYNYYIKAGLKVPIDSIVQQAGKIMQTLRERVQGLYNVLAKASMLYSYWLGLRPRTQCHLGFWMNDKGSCAVP